MDCYRFIDFFGGRITLYGIDQLPEQPLHKCFLLLQAIYFGNIQHCDVHNVYHWFIMEHQNTEITIAIIAATILFIVFAGFIITFLFFYNQKKKLHYEEMKEQQKIFEQEALVSRLEIREQTLKQIAEEIHDNVGQEMLLAKLNLNKLLMAAPNEAIEEIRDIIGDAINDLRDISKSLHSEQVSSLSLPAAIEKEMIRLKKTGFVNTSLTIDGDVVEIESSRKLILFRMTQEILQNAIKHSKSTEININLDFQKEFLILSIEDNGGGFNVDEKLKSGEWKGAGLLNLQNRANALRASLSIKSQSNEGTCIIIKFPLLL